MELEYLFYFRLFQGVVIVWIELYEPHIAGVGQLGDHPYAWKHLVDLLNRNNCIAISEVVQGHRSHVVNYDHVFRSRHPRPKKNIQSRMTSEW